MELVLTLIRNVLAIPNEDPRFVTSTTTYLSHLQEDFIHTLHEESAYEMILLFAQVPYHLAENTGVYHSG